MYISHGSIFDHHHRLETCDYSTVQYRVPRNITGVWLFTRKIRVCSIRVIENTTTFQAIIDSISTQKANALV